MSMSVKVKEQLVRLGRHIDERNFARLRSALGYMEIGALIEQELGAPALPMVPDRFGVFREAVRRVSGAAPVYLEFGVAEGTTMRWWAENLRQPGARLIGFDSFEGLPERWRPGFDAGRFRSSPPEIDDERVEYVTGWFDETLPSFTLPPHDQLIVNVDSDLYSSAKTVLSWAVPHLTTGSLLYFDELADRDHELLALNELLRDCELPLRPLVAGGGGAHLLLEVC
jgi:hypothetical protein